MAADAIVPSPVVEEGAHRSDAHGAVRDRLRRDVLPRRRHRDPELRPDQEEVGRIEMVQLRELRDRRVVALRQPGERVARPDDVDQERTVRMVRLRLVGPGLVGRVRLACHHDGPRQRYGLTPHDCGERVRADDPVPAQVEALLEEPDAVQRRAVEVRVDGDTDALPEEEELEHRDVPAEGAAVQRPRAEERAAERTEGRARPLVGDAGDGQPVALLKGANRGDGLRSRDRVDRAAVETLGAQGDLQAGRLGVPCAGERGRRSGHRDDRENPEQKETHAHGVPNYAAAPANPSLLYLPTKRGSRFSANAARPSFASSLANRSPNSAASRSSAPGERLSRRLATRSATGLLAASFWATSTAWSSTGSTIASTSPIRSASSALTWRPVRISSFATPRPQTRASRCVPPQPGTMPRSISGWPSRALLEA